MRVGTLTHEQARHFTAQGYYRLPAVFNKEETAVMREFVREQSDLRRAELKAAGKAGDGVMKLYGLYAKSPELMDKVVKHPVLTGALQSLLGPNVVHVQNRHNHATVNDHQGVPAEGLHRDILQSTRGLLTAAVYLQDSTIENGATRIIPGSHFWPSMGVPQADGGGTWMGDHEEYDGLEDQAIQVPMPEGGVLLFNGLVFHGVGHNSSGDTRMSMTLGFRSADELDRREADSGSILVAGDYLYRGNDRPVA